MADVEMTDAPVVNKKKGADGEEKKQRFEVKKVRKGNKTRAVRWRVTRYER